MSAVIEVLAWLLLGAAVLFIFIQWGTLDDDDYQEDDDWSF